VPDNQLDATIVNCRLIWVISMIMLKAVLVEPNHAKFAKI